MPAGIGELSACRFDVEHIEGYGSVKNDPELLKLSDAAITEALGADYVHYLEEPLSFSEDFSYYGNATGTPSLFLLLNAGYLGDAPLPCTTRAAPSRRRRLSAASPPCAPRR